MVLQLIGMHQQDTRVELSKNAYTAPFQKILIPASKPKYVPDDIDICIPSHDDIAPDRLHLLAYIPWDDNYLRHIPKQYHDFFHYVLPHLGVRTTNVHTALSISFLPKLIAGTKEPVNEHLMLIPF
jgi:hypothetical protein